MTVSGECSPRETRHCHAVHDAGYLMMAHKLPMSDANTLQALVRISVGDAAGAMTGGPYHGHVNTIVKTTCSMM